MSLTDTIKVPEEKHYKFGKNWTAFLNVLNQERIVEAEKSLTEYLGRTDLTGLRFLDIGCGSGLFSLCAKRLGAQVYSFDYDAQSVHCTIELRKRYAPQAIEDGTWIIEQGSVLDKAYMDTFRDYDIVYSWGVLHHTGNLDGALDRVCETVKEGGILFISIYNDMGRRTALWKKIKRAYNWTPPGFRFLFIGFYIIRYWPRMMILDTIRHGNPFYSFITYKKNRGMSLVYDMFDWLGGYPYETASCGAILNKIRPKGFELVKLKDINGTGCNEFVFERKRAKE